MITYPCFVDGRALPVDEVVDVVNPSTGELLAQVARGRAEHIDEAVAAARAAFPAWRATPVLERSHILRRIGAAIRREREELAHLESQDTGKPLSQARTDADVAARYFEFYANTVEAFYGETLPQNGDYLAQTRHEPYGVTGHIIPWNYPMQIGCRTIAPSLAVGNCCVVKPAEEAPLTVTRIAELAYEAGLPSGALNVVPGLGAEAGAALAGHSGIDHLSFTGSVPVGTAVAQAAAVNVIPVALELGGKSPNIVFPDADLDLAVPTIAKSLLQNAGQTCSAGSRLLVHESLHTEVVDRLEKVLAGIRIGPGPSDPDLGPLISARQLARVQAMVAAQAEVRAPRIGGGDGASIPQGGFYFPPTVFDDLDPGALIAQEEVFGPVLAVSTFDNTDRAVEIANGTEYGLIAAIWTRDLDVALRVCDEVQAGQVYVNTYGAGGGVEFSFGGFKKSGYGREKGFQALAELCQTKTVVIKVGRNA